MEAEFFHAETDRQTNMSKQTVAFRNFANAPPPKKKESCGKPQTYLHISYTFKYLCAPQLETKMYNHPVEILVAFDIRFNRHWSFLFYQQNLGIGSNTAKLIKLPLKNIHVHSVISSSVLISETPQKLYCVRWVKESVQLEMATVKFYRCYKVLGYYISPEKKNYENTSPFRNIHFDFRVKSTPSCKIRRSYTCVYPPVTKFYYSYKFF